MIGDACDKCARRIGECLVYSLDFRESRAGDVSDAGQLVTGKGQKAQGESPNDRLTVLACVPDETRSDSGPVLKTAVEPRWRCDSSYRRG